MATTTAPRKAQTNGKRGDVTDALVIKHQDVFHPKDGYLARYNFEREQQIDLMGVSLLAGIDPLFLGHPGVGKTWMIELLLELIVGAQEEDFFNTLVFKETPSQDVLGPMSPIALKSGKVERMMDGFLPTAILAYIDEVFKASPTLLNSLLDIMAQRKLKVGKTVHKVGQLISVFASSNELPDRQDLSAFRDRFAITNIVEQVKSPENRLKVMRMADAYQAGDMTLDHSDAPKLTLDDIEKMRAEVRRVIIPDAVMEKLNEAVDKWMQRNIHPSTRRQNDMLKAIKGMAYKDGRGEATQDDLLVTMHMAANDPTQFPDAREIVIMFANKFAREANNIKLALEPVHAALGEVQRKIAEAGREAAASDDDLMKETFEVSRSLNRLAADTKKWIETGKRENADVSDLENILNDITRETDWLDRTLQGKDED